jgi:hypothetical protein
MKQLVFVTGDNCNLSEEMQEKVDLFHTISPEVEIIRMETGKDENAFTALTGRHLQQTPTFAALVDGEVVDMHIGKLCEMRLGKMFTGGDPDGGEPGN